MEKQLFPLIAQIIQTIPAFHLLYNLKMAKNIDNKKKIHFKLRKIRNIALQNRESGLQ